jgi:hypothetical protein
MKEPQVTCEVFQETGYLPPPVTVPRATQCFTTAKVQTVTTVMTNATAMRDVLQGSTISRNLILH